MLTGGVAKLNLKCETIDNTRTFTTLCDEELRINRTGVTRWNTLDVVDRSDRRFEVRVTRCRYHETRAGWSLSSWTSSTSQRSCVEEIIRRSRGQHFAQSFAQGIERIQLFHACSGGEEITHSRTRRVTVSRMQARRGSGRRPCGRIAEDTVTITWAARVLMGLGGGQAQDGSLVRSGASSRPAGGDRDPSLRRQLKPGSMGRGCSQPP